MTMRIGVSQPVQQAFPRITNLEAACRVIGQLRMQGKSIRLGANEQPITFCSSELGPKHFPNFEQAEPSSLNYDSDYKARFRAGVLGFLAGAEKIKGGIGWLSVIQRQCDQLNVPEQIKIFRDREMSTYPEPWPNDSKMPSLMRNQDPNFLIQLGWFLRDQALLMPSQTVFDSLTFNLEILKQGRVSLTPATAQKLFQEPAPDRPFRITGFQIKNEWFAISRWGRIYVPAQRDHRPVTDISIDSASGVLTVGISPLDDLKFPPALYQLRELSSITLTQAPDPEIIPAGGI